LKNILAFDERFGCITLEPGVTFQHVHDYLAEQNSRWFLPVIGGPADASVIGNFVERGDGAGPQGGRLANMCGLEVVLPSGEVVCTGFERFGETPLTPLSSMPAGPWLDGLFTQSNFGIVTRATLWLVRHPECFMIVSARVAEADLAGLIDALQPLLIKLGFGTCSFTIWNGYKLRASAGGQSSANLLSDRTWFVGGRLYASSALMGAAQKELTLEALQQLAAQVQIFDEVAIPNLREEASLFLGVPSNENVRSLYLHKHGPVPDGPLDPDRDRCGVIWLCPEVPFDGPMVGKTLAICESGLKEAGFDPVISMDCYTPRSLHLSILILYDRETPGEDERAMLCHDQLLEALAAIGIFPFRLGIQSMPFAAQSTGACWNLIRRLKQSLDPNGTLAPGRYDGNPLPGTARTTET